MAGRKKMTPNGCFSSLLAKAAFDRNPRYNQKSLENLK